MPHGESWITIFLQRFLPGVWAWLHHAAQVFGWPFNDEGKTWIAHEPIRLTHVLSAALVVLILAVFAVYTLRRNRITASAVVPEDKLTLSSFTELFVSTTYGMMKDIMGGKAAKFFLPLIGTCAFFIFFSNALGLIPGLLPPTNNLNTTAACALVIFISTHVFGVKEHGAAYFKHFFGPVLKWFALPLMLLMLFIETISHLFRPLSLSLRLMANIQADHQVLDMFINMLGAFAIFIPVPLAVMLLGTIVVVVQTLVFCILSTVYIAMAVEHQDH